MRRRIERSWDWFTQPYTQRRLNGWFTLVWFLLAFPICIFLSESIPFLVFISVYAIVASHWATWLSSRVEVKQDIADPNTDTRAIEEKIEKKLDKQNKV